MSLLSVTVKKAHYVGAQADQFNTYVTLKLQNVKSTTVTVKGANPCWEQDFLFETNNINTGLLIEVWSKGMIWDRAMGYHWIQLQTIHYTIEDGNGQWLSLDAELVMNEGEVVGTKMPTGHSLLVDCRFELPFDPENIDAADLQRKLETLNKWIDLEAGTEQTNQHYNFICRSNSNHFDTDISAGYSEDSDYTSDLNYPVGQHPNSSASQFRTAANQINMNMSPQQRSLGNSKEDSYECEDSGGGDIGELIGCTTYDLGGNIQYDAQHTTLNLHRRLLPQQILSQPKIIFSNNVPLFENSIDSDPLFYNSRPRSTVADRLSFNQSCDEYYDTFSNPFQEEHYGQDPEDRQWDSGGSTACFNLVNNQSNSRKKLPPIPYISGCNKRNSSFSFLKKGYTEDQGDLTHCREKCSIAKPNKRRKMPQTPFKINSIWLNKVPDENCMAREIVSSFRGASLPPTPTKNSCKFISELQHPSTNKAIVNSLPTTPGRQLPIVNGESPNYRSNKLRRTGYTEYCGSDICENYYTQGLAGIQNYNENYNYAYRSIDESITEEDNDQVLKSDVNEIDEVNKIKICSRPYLDLYQKNAPHIIGKAEDDDCYMYDLVETGTHKSTDQINRIKGNGFKYPFSEISMEGSINGNNNSNQYQIVESNGRINRTINHNNKNEEKLRPTTNSNITEIYNDSTNQNQFHSTSIPTQEFQEYKETKRESTNSSDYLPDSVIIEETKAELSISDKALSLQQLTNYQSPNQHQKLRHQICSSLLEKMYPDIQEEKNDITTYTISHIDGPQPVNVQDTSTTSSCQQQQPITDSLLQNEADYLDIEEQGSLRRGSSQITVVDPFHPLFQRRCPINRRTSAGTPPPSSIPSSRKASGIYSTGYEDFISSSTGSRYPSIIDLTLSQRHGSVHNTSLPDTSVPMVPIVTVHDEFNKNIPGEGDQASPDIMEAHQQRNHPQLFQGIYVEGESDDLKEQRPKITAQQRWLWAYNKIIMQLNDVSKRKEGTL